MSERAPSRPSEVLDHDLVGAQEALERVSDAQCVEAMKTGDMEAVRAWYAVEEAIAEQDPTPQGHLNLIMKQAKLQFDAGLRDDALESLEMAHWDAMNRGDFESARRLEDISTQLKES
jgi:hypothetical protein